MIPERKNKILNSGALAAFFTERGLDLSVNGLEQNLISRNIGYSDLILLNNEDLQKLGCKDAKKREDILQFFSVIPNQTKTWEQVINEKGAEKYNKTIMSGATKNCFDLNEAMGTADFKLNYHLPDDLLIENKRFASGFLVDALDNLMQETREIEKNISELEKANNARHNNNNKTDYMKWLLLSVAIPVLAYIWYYKFK